MHYHVLFCIYNWNYCGTFVVPKFLLPLETLDFTGVYLPVDFNVGSDRLKPLLPVLTVSLCTQLQDQLEPYCALLLQQVFEKVVVRL